jgi:nucleoside-diphosphate-sugar epimerase
VIEGAPPLPQGATIFLTGSTGLVGSNLVRRAVSAGYRVRALVRSEGDAEDLAGLGADPVVGDITDPEALVRHARGVDGLIHAAAIIGGTWSTSTWDDFDRINHRGAVHAVDAAAAAAVPRTVLLNTYVVFDWGTTLTERSPVIPITPHDSGYTSAKRAAYYYGMWKASQGQHISFVVPSGVYGPAPFPDRALVPTSFSGSLLAGLRGELDIYVKMRFLWVYVDDVVEITMRALERGELGERYLAVGRPEEAMSLAQLCNRANEIAGVAHRVVDDDPTREGSPYGSMSWIARRPVADPAADPSATTAALGVVPTSIEDGLRATIGWLREIGRF